MPINNIQQFRVRFSFVNESSVNGEPFKYSDNTMYFTITPRLEQGEQTYTKTLANPLKYYLEKLAPSNQDPYNTPVWIRFEGYVILRQVSQITLAVDSQSENWAEGVTFPSSGRWVKMNNSGRVFRFTGGGNRPKHRTVYSVSAMIKVTDNKEIKETVLAGLKRNKEKYGKKYCPCSLVRDENTVCMCKEFREMEEGTCHCQLYVKTKD